jgi:putative endonuclease
MMTNKVGSVMYTGFTSNLRQRVLEHKNHKYLGFTDKYNATILVYYEEHQDPKTAIHREKRIKEWKREWKDELAKSMNPKLEDLWETIM